MKYVPNLGYRFAMPQLPNHAKAEIDIAKLRDYCLSETHPRGRHKARVLNAALGITASDAGWFMRQILLGLATNEAETQENDMFGQRFKVDMPISRQAKTIVLRTIWIVRNQGAAPHFITCWAL